MNNTERTYNIPESNIARLDLEFGKLNRRGKKIGCAPFGYEVVSEFFTPDPNCVKPHHTTYDLTQLPQIKKLEIKIIGAGPKVEGYRFVGSLDHVTIPGNVVVRTVPGESVPTEFFQCSATCVHCNKIRNRKDTFVFLEEATGKHIQVGRNCLRDFFGHDPAQIARLLQYLWTLIANLDNDSEGGWGWSPRGGEYLNAIQVLANTVAIIRSFGWISRSQNDGAPTANNVSYLMTFQPISDRERSEYNYFVNRIDFQPESDTAIAIQAVEWLKSQKPTNEYIHNLKLMESSTNVPVSMLGYWCSLIPAFQRHENLIVEVNNKNRAKLNEYLGAVKEKVKAEVECIGISYIPGNYNTVCVHRMITTDGHTLVWFANTAAKMEKGGRYTISATVKKHDIYNDMKQTILTRTSVIGTVA